MKKVRSIHLCRETLRQLDEPSSRQVVAVFSPDTNFCCLTALVVTYCLGCDGG